MAQGEADRLPDVKPAGRGGIDFAGGKKGAQGRQTGRYDRSCRTILAEAGIN